LFRQWDTYACDKDRRTVKQKAIIIITTTLTKIKKNTCDYTKNTREWDNIIIITVFERALPGTNLASTTNNRLPSRSTDTESDYQHSEWLLLIEKRENRARARTHYDDYNTAAAWRSRTHYTEQLRVNGSDKWLQCCRMPRPSGIRFTVRMGYYCAHLAYQRPLTQHNYIIIIVRIVNRANRGYPESEWLVITSCSSGVARLQEGCSKTINCLTAKVWWWLSSQIDTEKVSSTYFRYLSILYLFTMYTIIILYIRI